MSTVAILLANESEHRIPELTQERTMASVPFGCRYRLIDFALSGIVNAGITNVGIITAYNYQSLMDHIETGKAWDLARKNGGLHILPPFYSVKSGRTNNLFGTRLEALIGARNFLMHCKEEYVLISSTDYVSNLDINDMINQHMESGADITLAVHHCPVPADEDFVSIVRSDATGRITDITELNDGLSEEKDIQINVMVMKREFLLYQLNDASAHGYTSLTRDIINRGAGRYNYRIYTVNGFLEMPYSLSDYYQCSMQLLNPEIRNQLFHVSKRPIFTKVHNSVPTVYREGCLVKNSLIADGCVIEGIVENCIIFRGVHVGKNTSVENCILLQDTYVGNNVYMNCVVTDKNVTVKDGRVLSGHEKRPFYLEKNIEV